MDKPKYRETELVEWNHFTICTEGMTNEEQDMLYNVIRTITKKYPTKRWGINLVPYTDFKEHGFKSYPKTRINAITGGEVTIKDNTIIDFHSDWLVRLVSVYCDECGVEVMG